ncbi:outer membrane receptor protein involved in Fe transport [Sinobacterium caligoides]|uniref:Outer membrane receptor protein involved in Fe transport n=1 Tax=Sinobacterium caligoides TaxID=933926 RepID=A0A3N2DJI6_9GAMM|nr:TonB-dependent receptor [Sinobacterium caligoides]ROR99945.1 outer membrane receptor protein involved in Fe transport [Sinobacterium caligoides]
MKNNFSKTKLTLAISAASLLHSSQLFADVMLEEVVVTATARAQSVEDIPYNISAVSGSDIEKANIIDAAELMKSVPGVAVVDRGYRSNSVVNSINIRGLNVDSAITGDYALVSAPTVSTYVNNTPLYGNFLLKDIERVEVLRGPQGTLYGSGSLGGTVRYIMAKPQLNEYSAKVSGYYSKTDGSDGWNKGGDLIANLPMGDMFAARVGYSTVKNDGVIDYVNLYQRDSNGVPVAPNGITSYDGAFTEQKDADTVDIDYVRASLLFSPTDWFNATLNYQQQSDDIGSRRATTPGLNGYGESYDDYENGSMMLEPSHRDIDMYGLEMEFDLGFATLTSSTSTYDHEGEIISDSTGFYSQLGWYGDYYYYYPRPLSEAVRGYEDKSVIQELRLVSNDSDAFIDYVAGVYYQDQDTSQSQTSLLHGFKAWTYEAWGGYEGVISDKDFSYVTNNNFKDLSFYGELTFNISDDFRTTVGARHYSQEFSSDQFMSVGLWDVAYSEQRNSNKVEDSGTLFKFNAAWDMTDTAMLYGTFSQGYRRGGTNTAPTQGNFAEDPVWTSYEPDKVNNYELGVKGATDNFRYTLSAFYVDWDKPQLNSATDNWAFFAVQNAESARTQGIELSIDGYLTEQWHYSAGYAYVDAELTDDMVSPGSGALKAPDGSKLPGIPSKSFNIATDYTINFSSDLSLVTRVSGYYQSATENSVLTSERFNETLDAFSIWNLSTTLTTGQWDASLWLKNMFNEEGVSGVYKEEYMGTSPSQNFYGNGSKEVISEPRTLGVSASYNF